MLCVSALKFIAISRPFKVESKEPVQSTRTPKKYKPTPRIVLDVCPVNHSLISACQMYLDRLPQQFQMPDQSHGGT